MRLALQRGPTIRFAYGTQAVRTGVWDQALKYGTFDKPTLDGNPAVTVFDRETCGQMLADFAGRKNDIFLDAKHEVTKEGPLTDEELQEWGRGRALAWYSAMAHVSSGQIVEFAAHDDTQQPDLTALVRADGTPPSDGLYLYRSSVTPIGADPGGLPAFRYVSPYFVQEPGGYRLINITATNDPYLDGVALAMERQAMARADDDDFDLDDGEVDVEHFPLPRGLLKAAGIESDEDYDEIPEWGARRAHAYDSAQWDENKHPRADDGKFGSGAGKSKAAPKSTPKPAAAPAEKPKEAPKADAPKEKPARASKGSWSKAETTPIPKREDGKPGGGAGAQLDKGTLDRLKALGVNKLPAAHIADVQVTGALHDDKGAHDGALLRWKDDKGKEQRAYSAEFDRRNAEKKWERVLTNRPKVDAHMDNLRAEAEKSPGAAAALTIALTGLRPGGAESVKSTGHYGVTTMEARHVSFDDDGAHIQYVGKAGKVNKATITDPACVAALKKNTEGKGPTDRVFDGPSSKVAEALPKGVKVKDLRTLVATTDAERQLADIEPKLTGDKKKDARQVIGILKAVSTQVSKQLNNTPAMARRSYIAPQVIRAWGEKHGIDKTWLGDTPVAASRENDMDEEQKALMARAGCMEGDAPEAQRDKLIAHSAKMEAEGNPAEALRSLKMAVDPGNPAQGAIVRIKTGNQHDGKGDGPSYDAKKDPSAHARAMEDKPFGGKETPEEEKKEQAMQRRVLARLGLPDDERAAAAKLQAMERAAAQVPDLQKQVAEIKQVQAMEATRKLESAGEAWAEQALRAGRWDPSHAGGDEKEQDPAKRISMTRAYLRDHFVASGGDAAKADRLLLRTGTFQPDTRVVMERMTDSGRTLGAPDPNDVSLDEQVDRAVAAELRAAKAKNETLTTRQAMERAQAGNPALFTKYVASGRTLIR